MLEPGARAGRGAYPRLALMDGQRRAAAGGEGLSRWAAGGVGRQWGPYNAWWHAAEDGRCHIGEWQGCLKQWSRRLRYARLNQVVPETYRRSDALRTTFLNTAPVLP